MSKKAAGKSIIANFAISSAPKPMEAALLRAPDMPFKRVGAGVIGATQRSLTEIREERDHFKALVVNGVGLELDPTLVEPSPFPDRLPDENDRDFESLKKLILEEGQKVPIQVRTHPTTANRFQIVYGHRRWRACRELGIAIKAIVVELNDSELVVAQGIENAARQDLSWIERALFTWRMDEAGIKARDIRAALGVDDLELARLRAVCRTVPIDVIEAIGRAPKVGRPRWGDLVAAIAAQPKAVALIRNALAADKVLKLSSDDRFARALAAIKSAKTPELESLDLASSSGDAIGRVLFSASNITLSINKTKFEAFASFLKTEIGPLVERFLAEKGGA